MTDGNMLFGGSLTFNHHEQEWSIFKCRFTQYCAANNITEQTDKSGIRRRALLLTFLVEDTYRVARDLVYPEELDTLEFTAICEKFDTHFHQKKSSFAERYKFYEAKQRTGEELGDWAARVRSLARFCGFKSSELDVVLRDRFVLGLENTKEKEKLFAENVETLTFNRAVELAQSVRCARQALAATRGGS